MGSLGPVVVSKEVWEEDESRKLFVDVREAVRETVLAEGLGRTRGVEVGCEVK